MQCLNPIISFTGHSINDKLIDYKHINSETGEIKKSLHSFFNFNALSKKIGKENVLDIIERYGAVVLPCRKCVNCQLNRSREWAIRNTLESKYYDENSRLFITLTYDDTFLNYTNINNSTRYYIDSDTGKVSTKTLTVASLYLPDLQNFLKKLRKYYRNNKIRYYACGEYGSKTLRPHYHILLYGLGKKDIKDLEYQYTSNKNDYYGSDTIEKIWKKGFVNITTFSEYTAMYVSRYCTKKQGNYNYSLNYGFVPEFNTMSRRPGIANQYYIDNKDNIYKNDEFFYHIEDKTLTLKPIKFFDRLYDYENPNQMQYIKDNRKQFWKAYEYFSRLESDLQYHEYLENQAKSAKNKLNSRKEL